MRAQLESINLVCKVDKTISFLTNKTGYLQAPEDEGSRTYTSTVEDGDVEYVNQIPNPEYVNQIPTPEYVNA